MCQCISAACLVCEKEERYKRDDSEEAFSKGERKEDQQMGGKGKNIKEKTESKIQPTAGTQRLMMNMYSNKVPHAANRGAHLKMEPKLSIDQSFPPMR